MQTTAKTVDVNLVLWEEDFVLLMTKMIEFQQTAYSTKDFYFDRTGWRRGFDSAVNPSAPLDPTNLSIMAFYALEYLVSQELSDDIRDAKTEDMLDELNRIIAVVYTKNKDYGSSALTSPLLLPWFDVRFALLVRLSDKIQRLHNLYSLEKPEVNESLEDTLRDIVGYVFLIYATIRTVEVSGKEDRTGEGSEV